MHTYIHVLTNNGISSNMHYIIINISIINVNQLQIINTDSSNKVRYLKLKDTL